MTDVVKIAQRAKQVSRQLALAGQSVRDNSLMKIADQIWESRDAILAANQLDVEGAKAAGLTPAMVDRLLLNEKRLAGIVNDLRSVADLPDPVGEVFEASVLPNGLRIHKQRVPLGVLAVIYEARPNVTVDVTGLALKSGNCAILRGGSETIRSNRAMIVAIHKGLNECGLPESVIQLIDDPDRALVNQLLQQDAYIDMVIPRGGAGLHDFCKKNSRIPVITGGIGICHLFVDETADLTAAVKVVENAKVQRPTVCNALDTILVHRSVVGRFIPAVVEQLAGLGVSFRADPEVLSVLNVDGNTPPVLAAGPNDFDTEWLSLVLGIRVVGGLDEAMAHIAAHSTAHSDGILTRDDANAARFVSEVDSAAVYVNASTRFTDGAQLGLGAEVAISTQRLHARGPMGLRELTTFKWVIQGDYHVRP
jgi:glutamate-5-semialdehyde dehydrogenase